MVEICVLPDNNVHNILLCFMTSCYDRRHVAEDKVSLYPDTDIYRFLTVVFGFCQVIIVVFGYRYVYISDRFVWILSNNDSCVWAQIFINF